MIRVVSKNTSDNRKAPVLAVALLSGVLPLALGIAALVLRVPDYVNNGLHAFLEVSGGGTALVVAGLVWLRLRDTSTPRHFLWVCAALVSMGGIDIFHGSLPLGPAWAWTRYIAAFLGGLFFGCVWFPLPEFVWTHRRFSAYVTFAFTAAVIVISWKISPILPAAWTPSGYTFWPIALILFSTVAFFTATAFFIYRLRSDVSQGNVVFAAQTLLLGISSALFPFSHVWGDEWWLWHFLRLCAYLVVARSAYLTVADMNSELLRRKEDLQIEVQSRTKELRQSLADTDQVARRLSLQLGVTRVLANSNSLHEATNEVLAIIGSTTGCEASFLWQVNAEKTALACITTWNVSDLPREFVSQCQSHTFTRGVGLPGQAWAAGKPIWITDVSCDGNFPRSPSASTAGLHGAFAFPVFVGGEVDVVIEFFSRQVREPEAELLVTLEGIGAQISRFVLHQRGEAKLRESEARKSSILASALDAIITMDGSGRIVEFNPAAEKMFGQSAADVNHRLLEEVIIPKRLRESHRRGLAHYLTTGVGPMLNHRVETSALRGDGTEFPVELSILRISGIEPPLFSGFIRDITDRKRADEALRESEERFRMLGDNIAQLAWMANADGSIFWYNKRWYEFTGTDLEQMMGWGWEKVHHPDHIRRVTEKWKTNLNEGEAWEDTFPLRGKDGAYRWFLSRAFPIRDAQNNIVRWFGTNTDVTELREAQAAITEREAVLRTVTSEARVGLVMVNGDREYLFANETYADILGLNDLNIVGKRLVDVLPTVYNDQIKARLDRAFGGERVYYELNLPATEQEAERYYEVTYEPRIVGDTAYVVVVLVEVTDRKKAQVLLERAVAARTTELKESNEQLEAFVYSIAHDLRGPLRAMQGYSEMLTESQTPLPDHEREFLKRIRNSAEYMDTMITDLLAFGRTASMDIQVDRVDLQKVWDSAIYQCSRQIEQAHALIHVKSPLLTVRAYEPILTQIVANLLTNAMKFIQPGVMPRIDAWCEDLGPAVRLLIRDNGIGIAPEYHERIFGVFERLHGTSYPGTGIGLSIVRKGVERMKGKVGLESSPGNGTLFWIELPKP